VYLGALSSRVKYPRRDADHSPPSIADVSIKWSCASTLPYGFIAFTGTALLVFGNKICAKQKVDKVLRQWSFLKV
jgi:hypothetical protein